MLPRAGVHHPGPRRLKQDGEAVAVNVDIEAVDRSGFRGCVSDPVAVMRGTGMGQHHA